MNIRLKIPIFKIANLIIKGSFMKCMINIYFNLRKMKRITCLSKYLLTFWDKVLCLKDQFIQSLTFLLMLEVLYDHELF